MVINRIQTVYLILAIALMTVFLFVPYAYLRVASEMGGTPDLVGLKAIDFLGFIIPTAATLLLLLLSIFMFHNLRGQRFMVVVAMLLTIAEIIMVVLDIVSGAITNNPTEQASILWGGGGILLIGAVIVEAMAIHGINSDQKKLSSYNRLR